MQQIYRASLHSEIVPLIRDMMINGELKPGDKIHEVSLCERFGVSRTPLREALKVLANEGLIENTVNRGSLVARVTRREIDELFPIMGVLEGLAGESVVDVASAADMDQLHDMHNTMVAHYRQGDWAAYIKMNRLIHQTLFTIANNASLTALYNSLLIRTHSVRFIARKSPERWAEAVDDHTQLMAALDARDGEKVRRILREHLRHKAEMVHEALAEIDNCTQVQT